MKQIKNWFTSLFILTTYFLLLLEIFLSTLMFIAIPIAMTLWIGKDLY